MVLFAFLAVVYLTVEATDAAPPITLELVLGTLAAGSLILFPALLYLMRVFKGKVRAAAG